MISKIGKLIIFTGPSGVGKKTIWSNIINNKKYHIVYSISMTTRQPRQNEINSVDYFFVSKKQFESSIKNNELLEWAQYANNYYGTPKKFVLSNLKQNKNVFLEIEIQGALNIIKNWNYKDNLVTIFVAPPSLEILEQRLRNRNTESEEDIKKRIKQSKNEILHKNKFKYEIVNDDVDIAKKKFIQILNNEICK